MIRVLVVDDSPVARRLLDYILSTDPNMRVVGFACDGEEAVEQTRRVKPDVITMDIRMPRADGFEATRKIMEIRPTPVVIVSASWNSDDVRSTCRVMEAGAVAAVCKPPGLGHPDYERLADELIQTVRLMSEVKVVTRRRPKVGHRRQRPPVVAGSDGVPRRIEAAAIGVSTGGPPVLQTILSALPRDFPIPILVVQHIARGFLVGMLEWLDKATPLTLRVASDGEPVKAGCVYFAPDGAHMGVNGSRRIALVDEPPEHGVRPSVSFLFRSVADAFGPRAVGVLLTGMGKDGAQELKRLRDLGAVTVAQDEESSVVFGMPGEAVKLGAAAHVLPPSEIARLLLTVTAAAPHFAAQKQVEESH